jgi:hypothetical protein
MPAKTFRWNSHDDFPRDFKGYGEKSFNPQWPNGAKVAISFVINYEEVFGAPLTFRSLIWISDTVDV